MNPSLIQEQVNRGWLIPLSNGNYRVSDAHPDKDQLMEDRSKQIDDALSKLMLDGDIAVRSVNEDGKIEWELTEQGWESYDRIQEEQKEVGE